MSALVLAMSLSFTAVPAAGATYTVSGTITMPAGLAGLWLDVSVMQDEFTSVGLSPSLLVTGTSVPYSVSGVPPGTYYLEASGSFLNGRNGIYPTTSQLFTVTGNGTVNLTALPAYLVRPQFAGGVSADVQFYRTCSDFDPLHPRPVRPLFVPGEDGFELPPGTFKVIMYPKDHDFLTSWHSAKLTCESADPVVISGDGDVFLQPATGGWIEGTVTYHGQPLKDVTVQAYAAPGWGGAPGASSDASGHYRIGPLEEGNYYVGFNSNRGMGAELYLQWWRNALHRDQASVVEVHDQPVTGINAGLLRAASLSGTVHGPNGPVGGARILISETYRCDPVLHCEAYYYANTDSDGRWTVMGMIPGTYTVKVKAGSPLGQEYWNNKVDYKKADPITLAPEEVCTGLDFYRKVAEPKQIVATCSGGVVRAQTLARPPTKLKAGAKVRLSKKTDAGQKVAWTGRTKPICRVQGAHLKALREGRCKIRATAAATPGWKRYAKTFTIRVR